MRTSTSHRKSRSRATRRFFDDGAPLATASRPTARVRAYAVDPPALPLSSFEPVDAFDVIDTVAYDRTDYDPTGRVDDPEAGVPAPAPVSPRAPSPTAARPTASASSRRAGGPSEDELMRRIDAADEDVEDFGERLEAAFRGAEQATARPATAPSPAPPSSNAHAIFEQLTPDLNYANTFDLGTVALDRARFDALAAEVIAETDASPPPPAESMPVEPATPSYELDDAELLRSIERIQTKQAPAPEPVASSPEPTPTEQVAPPEPAATAPDESTPEPAASEVEHEPSS